MNIRMDREAIALCVRAMELWFSFFVCERGGVCVMIQKNKSYKKGEEATSLAAQRKWPKEFV